MLKLYFKLLKFLINKTRFSWNKSGKSTWDWLSLNSSDTFTKILGAIFFWGSVGIFGIVSNFILINFIIPLEFIQRNIFAVSIINYYKLHYNLFVSIYFITWFITICIIVKNHKN